MRLTALCTLLLLFVCTAGAAAPGDPPVLTVAAIHAAPPVGKAVRVLGFVVDSYNCPPCPPDMTCKPCMHASSITIADSRKADAATIMLSVPWARTYPPGVKFRFDITVGDRDGFDGHVDDMRRA